MNPVRDEVMRKTRVQGIESAYKAHPNHKSFDQAWVAMGRPVHTATWNTTLTPSLIINLIESQT